MYIRVGKEAGEKREVRHGEKLDRRREERRKRLRRRQLDRPRYLSGRVCDELAPGEQTTRLHLTTV